MRLVTCRGVAGRASAYCRAPEQSALAMGAWLRNRVMDAVRLPSCEWESPRASAGVLPEAGLRLGVGIDCGMSY
jgi:hypothetical protein